MVDGSSLRYWSTPQVLLGISHMLQKIWVRPILRREYSYLPAHPPLIGTYPNATGNSQAHNERVERNVSFYLLRLF
jgi:hypothetical protein